MYSPPFWQSMMEILLDICFMTDIAICFITAYDSQARHARPSCSGEPALPSLRGVGSVKIFLAAFGF